MDSHHFGSNTVLRYSTELFILEIKRASQAITLECDPVVSTTTIGGICGELEIGDMYKQLSNGVTKIQSAPLFFEETQYKFVLEPTSNSSVITIKHDSEKINSNFDTLPHSNVCIGIVNFKSSIGFSKFYVVSDSKRLMELEIEIFPSKMRYREDYIAIKKDISNELHNLVFDFLNITFQNYDTSQNRGNSLGEYFVILRKVYSNLINSLERIVCFPHHRIVSIQEKMSIHKIRLNSNRTIKYFNGHPEKICGLMNSNRNEKMMAFKKEIKYDSKENQFIKYAVQSVIKKITRIQLLYESHHNAQKVIIDEMVSMKNKLNSYITNSFLSDIEASEYDNGMSLVMIMAAGYREFYKQYLLLSCTLNISGEIFDISVKDLSLLYEYWCFIKIYSILKEYYPRCSQSLISVKNNGLRVELRKGVKSEIVMTSIDGGDSITISYNKKYENMPTTDQMPDNVVKIQKKAKDGTCEIQYVFDAKYRIDSTTEYVCRYGSPGPKEETINAMHRYRDAIVYSDNNNYYRSYVGAFVLFPFSGNNDRYRENRFFKSIDKVNIGGIPFLPDNTSMMTELLHSLIVNPIEYCRRHFVHSCIKYGECNIEPDIRKICRNPPN